MSYILDALKKAERERGISQVPTLSTVHDLRERPPIRLLMVSGMVVLCIVALFLIYFFRPYADDQSKPLLAEEPGNVADRPESKQLKSPVPADEPLSLTRSSEFLTTPDSQFSREIPDSAGQEPVVRDRQAIETSHSATNGRAVTSPSSGESTPASSRNEPAERQSSQPPAAGDRIEVQKPSAGAAVAGQVSLHEAINEMSISILLYSESKAERLVFINGRKYVEGDMVEGNFLLESITQEGAVLSYKGEREILRPGRN